MAIITEEKMRNLDRDILNIGEANNEDKVINPRYGQPFKSLPMLSRLFESMISTGYLAIDDLQTAIDIALEAGAGSAGWTAQLIADSSTKTQQELNNGSIFTVGSVAEMLALDSAFEVRTVRIKATGAMYTYDPEKQNVNDGFYVLNGWVLVGYNDRLLATLAGVKGDGSNEYAKVKSLIDVASSLNLPIDLCRLNICTSNLVASGNLKFIGLGGIKLFDGYKGTLLTTAYDLEINGRIVVDQNKDANASGPVTSESDCAIKHTGDSLILRGAIFKPSASVNISTRPKKLLICDDLEISGGQVCLFVVPAPDAKVVVDKGIYEKAGVYDNIQINSGSDISITNVTSRYAARSGIVVSNETKKARIIANLCYGNKKDSIDQGGWGIVCSVNTQDTLVANNILVGNQVGGISMDTFPDAGQASLGSRLCVSTNIVYGLFEGSYGITGISLNDASNAIVSNNYIFKVAQGIHTDRAHSANIFGNTIRDVTAYFVQLYRSDDVSLGKNLMKGCSVSGAASVNCIDSSRFNIDGPTIRDLTGLSGSVIRVSGTSKDWTIQNLDVVRSVAGTGYIFNILGSGVTNGVIKNNTFKGLVNASWQWFIASDNNAQCLSLNNIIIAPGTNYIFQGANITAGDDTINNKFNYYTANPTFKSREGQMAVINGVKRHFDGAVWV
ncbi:right-handed parallel beta-helix repeat-containing protein [Acinetobacter baumannii]|nr:right-handed parallel beta-helix repeat-containing protein [Acinetobacter baumannii]